MKSAGPDVLACGENQHHASIVAASETESHLRAAKEIELSAVNRR
jgi:hypothetical protein